MNTILYPLLGTLFTFLMTTLGSALVFFFKDEIKDFYQQLFLGFAAGIMIAAFFAPLMFTSPKSSWPPRITKFSKYISPLCASFKLYI